MRCLGRALTVLVALVCAGAQAAELTRLASSFDDDHPFGMYIDVGFERTQHREKIVREAHQAGQVQDVSELRYTMIDSRLNLDAHIGLWKDLDFHFGLPIVFQQDRKWRYAAGTDDTNSTLANNCIQPNGELLDPNCPVYGSGHRPITPISTEGPNSYRGGFGDMTFGLAYAIFNQRRDDTKPVWVLGVDYTAPTASLLDPTAETTSEARGAMGDRNHKYKVYTTFSRRMGIADPYVQLHYTLPWHGSGWYSNCDHPDPSRMGRPDNCNTDVWSRAETGIKLPHRGGMIFGTEFNAYDSPETRQKVALDLRAIATYVSEGRYYNEVSDLFGKLMSTGDYFELGGTAGFTAHAAEYVHLKALATLLYQTEHTLTNETIGKDVDGTGTVDVAKSPIEVNPNYDWRVDMLSRRLRSAESVVFRIDVQATFAF